MTPAQTPGLRARQKQQRREEITAAALVVFTETGFAHATLDQIASKAGVSAPTVVNYFGGKQQILLALLSEPDQKAIQEVRMRLADYLHPLDALCELEQLMTTYQLKALPAALWRELAPYLFTGELSDTFQPWNAAVVEEARAVLEHFRAQGVIAEGTDIQVAATVFNQYANLAFIRLATEAVPNRAAHARHMRSVFELLCEGMVKR